MQLFYYWTTTFSNFNKRLSKYSVIQCKNQRRTVWYDSRAVRLFIKHDERNSRKHGDWTFFSRKNWKVLAWAARPELSSQAAAALTDANTPSGVWELPMRLANPLDLCSILYRGFGTRHWFYTWDNADRKYYVAAMTLWKERIRIHMYMYIFFYLFFFILPYCVYLQFDNIVAY